MRITNHSCDRAVKRWFGPLAEDLGLRLVRVHEKLYEIVSPYFTLRLRVGIGPWTQVGERTSLEASIVPTEKRHESWEDLTNEIGVYVVAAYYGEHPRPRGMVYRWDFWLEAKSLARFTRKYCKPFLLGETKDHAKVREFLDMKNSEGVAEVQQLLNNLSATVKPMWRLEGESDVEWRQRLEGSVNDWKSKRSSGNQSQGTSGGLTPDT